MAAEQGRILPFDIMRQTQPYTHAVRTNSRPPASEIRTPFKMNGRVLVDFKLDRQEQQEHFFSTGWLKDTVARERRKLVTQGERPWYDMAGTGFWVKSQVAQLVRNTKGAMKDVAPDVLELELAKVKEDKRAFIKEYLEQMVNLQFNLAWKDVNGEKRIVCPNYGNVLWAEVTDPMERDGVVHQAIAGNPETGEEGLETKLRDAPNGSLAVAISNEGWSGLHDVDGKPITFPETQIYLIKKLANGELRAYTLRYKANILQNEELQRHLGLPILKEPDQKERIKQLMKNTTVITPEDADHAAHVGRKPVRDFVDVVDLMQKVVGGREVAYEGKTFDDMRSFLRNPEAFNRMHPLMEPLIKRFQEYAREEIKRNQLLSDLETNLQIAMAFTILQMNKLYRVEEQQKSTIFQARRFSSESATARAITLLGNMEHKKEVEDLKKRPGCAGGGASKTSMGATRKGESSEGSESEDYDFNEVGMCVVCSDGPKRIGPCKICIPCDAALGGKGAGLTGLEDGTQKDFALVG